MFVVFVDDIIMICDDMREIEGLKSWLANEFEMKNLGKLK